MIQEDTQEDAWREANQRHLAAALAEVRELLQGTPPGSEIESETAPGGAMTTLDALTAMFELSPFERDVLLLCAGMELEPVLRARGTRRMPPSASPWPPCPTPTGARSRPRRRCGAGG